MSQHEFEGDGYFYVAEEALEQLAEFLKTLDLEGSSKKADEALGAAEIVREWRKHVNDHFPQLERKVNNGKN